jgi:hypothetical protein
VLAAVTDQGRDVLGLAIVTYAQAVRQRFVYPLTRSQMSSLGDNCQRISTASTSPGPDGKAGRH